MTPKEIASIDGILDKKNVVSISTGIKQVGGVYTNEQCAVVGVISKEPLDDLDANDIVPSVLSDGSTKTDIVAIGEIVPHGACPTSTSTCSDHGTIDHAIVGGTQIYNIKSSFNSTSYLSYGTLGAIVRDNDGSLVGLTNNHVVGSTYHDSIGYQWGESPTDDDPNNHKSSNPSCTFPSSTADTYTKTIYYGDYYATNIELGTVKRLVPIIFNQPSASHAANYCDAALVNLDSSKLLNYYPSPVIFDSNCISNHSNTAPIFNFSNLGDINNTNICIKIGRTTGRTVRPHDTTLYDPSSGHVGIVTSTDSDIVVNFISSCSGYSGTSEGNAAFRNTIAIKYQNAASDWRFSYSGDSGSLCWIWNNSRWEVLGLIFAGGCDGDNLNCTSYVCRIDYILKQLNIGEGWTNDPAIGSDTQSLFNYIGTTASTTLSDVSACANLWNGEIILPPGFTDTTFQLKGNSQDSSICYTRVSGADQSLSTSHTTTDLSYSGSTSGSCGSAFDVDIVSVSPGTITVDSSSPGASNVYTINGVSAAKLKLTKGKQYLFRLNSSSLRTGGSHPFVIKDNHFNTTNTYGPCLGTDFFFTLSTSGASAGFVNYTCTAHGPNMGNFIFFD